MKLAALTTLATTLGLANAIAYPPSNKPISSVPNGLPSGWLECAANPKVLNNAGVSMLIQRNGIWGNWQSLNGQTPHVQVGDHVILAMEGDIYFPYQVQPNTRVTVDAYMNNNYGTFDGEIHDILCDANGNGHCPQSSLIPNPTPGMAFTEFDVNVGDQGCPGWMPKSWCPTVTVDLTVKFKDGSNNVIGCFIGPASVKT